MENPDWVAAIGQVLGAVFTAVAAWIALFTAKTAKTVAERGVVATERQTSLAAIQDLLSDYASPEMYNALRRFGRFVGNDEQRKERFRRITEHFKKRGRRLEPDATASDDFAWMVQELEKDMNLGAARRQIHHHFKRIWALRRTGIVADADLLLLTSANYGYDLWRDEVLPATVALGLAQEARGRPSAATEEWPRELIVWVEGATHAPAPR
jgi:hypothetical protein